MEVPDEKPKSGTLYAMVAPNPTQNGIYWVWYQWKLDPDFAVIRKQLCRTVRDTIGSDWIWKATRSSGFRGLFEWFSIQCATLSGDRATMRLASGKITGSTGRPGQFYESLAGILKGKIDGDEAEIARQFSFYLKQKEDKAHPAPSTALLKAFVDCDYDALNKEIVKNANRYWSKSFIGKAIVSDKPGRLVINPQKRNSHYRWAYAEAAIAKLAIMGGATITHDDVWFPLDLVKSFGR